jgi:TPR repeat/Tetratricopeptide repeat
LQLANRSEEAEAAYRKAIELDSKAVAARFNLGLLFQQRGKKGKAIDVFQDLIEIAPGHAWGHFQLGTLYEAKGRRNKAIEHYARAFVLDPALTFARNNPALLDSKLAVEALIETERYQAKGERNVPRQYGEAARIRELMLRDPEAEAAAEEEGELATGEVSQKSVGTSRPGGSGEEGSQKSSRAITNSDLGGSSNPGHPTGRSTAGALGRSARPTSSFQQPVPPPGSSFETPAPVIAVPPGQNVGKGQPGVGTPPPTFTPPPSAPSANPPFRPSRRSTASLDWRFVPDDEAREGLG